MRIVVREYLSVVLCSSFGRHQLKPRRLLNVLHAKARKSVFRAESPSLGIIDSRSVKTSHHVDTDRGIDGDKMIKGRKEHIVVDTLGLSMAIKVHEANITFKGLLLKAMARDKHIISEFMRSSTKMIATRQ